MFEGTTAVAFSADEVAPAKVFCKHQKDLNKMAVKFGIVNGQIMDKAQVEELAKIPSKEVLIAMLLGTLNAPVSALARALNAIAEKQN
jgi:large subunit ribosomal protein L10